MGYDHHGLLLWEDPVAADKIAETITNSADQAGYNTIVASVTPAEDAEEPTDLVADPENTLQSYERVRIYNDDRTDPVLDCYMKPGNTRSLAFSYEEWESSFTQLFKDIKQNGSIDESVMQSVTLDEFWDSDTETSVSRSRYDPDT